MGHRTAAKLGFAEPGRNNGNPEYLPNPDENLNQMVGDGNEEEHILNSREYDLVLA
jgi:hypothetical protein